jgi:carbon monoxide dehydrogenase subunit G
VIRVAREIDVDRSASEVFERLTRIEDLPRWQPAISEARLTSGEPIGVGSTILVVAEAAGRRIEANGTVTEFVAPERIAFDATAGPAAVKARVIVVPTGAATSRVAVETEIRLGGMLRFVEGMARSRIDAEAPAAAAAIKEWLEGA